MLFFHNTPKNSIISNIYFFYDVTLQDSIIKTEEIPYNIIILSPYTTKRSPASILACAKTLFYFFYRSFRKNQGAPEKEK